MGCNFSKGLHNQWMVVPNTENVVHLNPLAIKIMTLNVHAMEDLQEGMVIDMVVHSIVFLSLQKWLELLSAKAEKPSTRSEASTVAN